MSFTPCCKCVGVGGGTIGGGLVGQFQDPTRGRDQVGPSLSEPIGARLPPFKKINLHPYLQLWLLV